MIVLLYSWIDFQKPGFMFTFFNIKKLGSIFSIAIEEDNFAIDILFLRKPILWFASKIKKLLIK